MDNIQQKLIKTLSKKYPKIMQDSIVNADDIIKDLELDISESKRNKLVLIIFDIIVNYE